MSKADNVIAAQTKSGDLEQFAISSNDNEAIDPIYGNSLTRDKYLRLYLASDIIGLMLSITCSWLAALAINNFIIGDGTFQINTYNSDRLIPFMTVSVGLIFWFAHSRHYSMRMPFWLEAQKIASALGFALLVDGFLQFASKAEISRLWLISSWIFAGFTIIALRSFIRFIALKRGVFHVPTLLIGSGATAQHLQEALQTVPEMGYVIIAQIKNLPEEFMRAGSSWKHLCEKYGTKHIIIAMDGADFNGTDKIMQKLTREPVSFSVAPALHNLPVTGMVPQHFMNHNVMLLTHSYGINQTIPTIVKRGFDILVSGLALLTLSPIMLIIGAMIKRDGGSSLFGHNRLGRGGKTFPCLKFRTMVMNGDEILKEHLKNNPEAAAEWKATQKLQNDPRVTRLGKFLRSTSLDELPQLLNVLKGDMSLVGPRPIVRNEVEHYNNDIIHYYRVRPGITGLWQVSGRNDVSYAQRVQMDSWYVRNWSLWHDITIICKTFPAVLKRSGAY